MDQEERDHNENLLRIYQAHLRQLEIMAAKYGGLAVPSHITLEIEENRRKITELERQRQAPTTSRVATPRHNLPPRDYEHFVGRQKELVEVRRLLGPGSRAFVVTIDGIGGIGKSSLALETAYTFVDQYDELPAEERFEAIVWVSAKHTYLTASGIRERRQVFRTLADVFGAIARVLDYPAITRVRAEEQREIVEQVVREQRTLLILDNLETVDDDDLMDFLNELPEPTKALVTTRYRIDVARPVRLTGMAHNDAIDLIVQEAARKDVTLAQEEQEELRQRTGGVPLAIVWSIGLMGLGGSIESVLRRLGSGQSDITRFCFEESMAQIQGRDAHKLLMALALFAADASREALGVVAGLGDDAFGRDTGLQELLRLSLVNKDGERFSLLPLTKGLIQSQTNTYQEWNELAKSRRNEYAFNILQWRADEPPDWSAIDSIERELPNYIPLFYELVASLRYVPSDQNEPGRVISEQEPLAKGIIQLGRTLIWICRFRGYWNDCESICRTHLIISKAMGDLMNVGFRCQDVGWLFLQRGELSLAAQWMQESQDTFLAAGALNASTFSEQFLGLIALRSGDLAQATLLIEHAYSEYLRLNDNDMPLIFLMTLGELAEQQGDLVKAEALYRDVVDRTRHAKNLHYLSFDLLSLARVRLAQGDNVDAQRYYAEALRTAHECGRKDAAALALYQLARLEFDQSNNSDRELYARESLDLFRRLGMKREQAEAEALLAKLTEESQSS